MARMSASSSTSRIVSINGLRPVRLSRSSRRVPQPKPAVAISSNVSSLPGCGGAPPIIDVRSGLISTADAKIGRRDLRVGTKCARGALEDDGAVIDDVDAVRESQRHLGVLLDQEHADALSFELQ